MERRRLDAAAVPKRYRTVHVLALAVVLTGCGAQAPSDLGVAVAGMDERKFLACAGPPVLEVPQGAQTQMSFVTNTRRGAAIGITSPTASPVTSCSVDAVFADSRVVTAVFSGDQGMCSLVFGPCLAR